MLQASHLNTYKLAFPHQFMKKHYLSKAGKRDVLLGMAQAGNSLAELPLQTEANNNWVKAMNGEYSNITSFHRDDTDYAALGELRKIHKSYQNKKKSGN
jgi:hypothetical protein